MSEPAGQQQKQQVQIKADEKELLGQYSNLAVIHHNGEEFTLNFIYLFPSVPQGKLVSSVILSPAHAKRLLQALKKMWRGSRRSLGRCRKDRDRLRTRISDSCSKFVAGKLQRRGLRG